MDNFNRECEIENVFLVKIAFLEGKNFQNQLF